MPWEDSEEEEKPSYSRGYFSNSDLDSDYEEKCNTLLCLF